MYKKLSDWIKNGEIKSANIIEHKLTDYATAFLNALTYSTNSKQVFVF